MNSKQILIIDDDFELCEETADLLRGEGYDATFTSDAREGQALIEKGMYDIVLLDYKMSGITGVGLLKNIKNKKMPARIFIVSGKPFIEKIIKEESLPGIVTAVIRKPIDFENLLKIIKIP